jgi:prepilin-type N-terminal cleavage/methylation domain-containing protein
MLKLKTSNLKLQSGFTLIELIVVFTVIGILSTVGTVSLVNYSRSQVLNQSATDLVQALNTAKSLSSSQQKTLDKNGSSSKGCLDVGQTLNGYGVQININKPSSTNKYSYNLYIQCIGSNGVKLSPVTDAKWLTKLSNDVTISSAADVATYTIFFPVLSGGIISNINSVTLLSYGNSKTVHLNNGYISLTSP